MVGCFCLCCVFFWKEHAFAITLFFLLLFLNIVLSCGGEGLTGVQTGTQRARTQHPSKQGALPAGLRGGSGEPQPFPRRNAKMPAGLQRLQPAHGLLRNLTPPGNSSFINNSLV